MKEKGVIFYMNEAIIEGKKALPQCLPNPPVGCVLVQGEKIVSRGHTQEPGKYHAEAMALAKIQSSNYNNVTMFVTLEPCSFHGKTPACANTIVTLGIEKVYVGILDPHPKNLGNGIKIMQEANINVVQGILEDQIHKELDDFLIWQ